MADNKLELPRTIWRTYGLFNETIIEECTLLEVTYDSLGLKRCSYSVPSGSSYVWAREYYEYNDLFETKDDAIKSVKNGNYSIYFIEKKN